MLVKKTISQNIYKLKSQQRNKVAMNKTCPTVNPYHRNSGSYSHSSLASLAHPLNYDIFKILSKNDHPSIEIQVYDQNYVFERAAYYFFLNFLKQNGQKGQEQMNYFKQYINNNSFLLNNTGDSTLILDNTSHSPLQLFHAFFNELNSLCANDIIAILFNKNNLFDKIFIRWVINFHGKCYKMGDVVSLFHKLNFRCYQMTPSDVMIGGAKISINGNLFRICNFRMLNKNLKTCDSQVSQYPSQLNQTFLESTSSLSNSMKKQSFIDELVDFLIEDTKQSQTEQNSPVNFKKSPGNCSFQDYLENTRCSTDFSNKSDNESSKTSLGVIQQQGLLSPKKENFQNLPKREPFTCKDQNNRIGISERSTNQNYVKPTQKQQEKIQKRYKGYCPYKIQKNNQFRKNYANIPTAIKTQISEQRNKTNKFPLSYLREMNRNSVPTQENYNSTDCSWIIKRN